MAKKKTPKPKTYRWDGGAKVHTISQQQHDANTQGMKNYGALPNSPLAGPPLTMGQGYGMATAAADRVYQPQIQAAQQTQANIAPWYQNYKTDSIASQDRARAYAAPMLATAQQGVTNAAATAPGLDPSSAQYATDQQAAQGRAALAQLGASSLGAVSTATDAYFGGQQNIAARDLPQTQAYAAGQVGSLQSQRGQAVTDELGKIRTGEQNYGIARSTLNLNTDKASADVDISRGVDPVTGKPLPADPVSASDKKTQADLDYFNKHGYYPTTGPPKSTGPTAAEKKAAEKEKAKKATAIKKSTGGVKTKVTDLIAKWDGYKGQQTDDTSKPMDPVTKQYPSRPVTPSDIKKILGAESKDNTPGLIHVMLLVRAGKPLDQQAIDYLHAKDPNIRVPREWLKGKKKAPLSRPKAPAPKNAPAGYGDEFGGT